MIKINYFLPIEQAPLGIGLRTREVTLYLSTLSSKTIKNKFILRIIYHLKHC